MNYEPPPPPLDPGQLPEYLARELRRVCAAMRDDATSVLYFTAPANQGSLTAAVSANYKIAAGNVIRLSTSNTVTLTGLAVKTPNQARFLVNVGTGVVVLKSEATESSASYRFLLSQTRNLSANAAVLLWYDSYSSRHRALT